MQKRTQTLEAAAAYDTHRFVLTNAGEPASLIGAEVSDGFFETLQSRAARRPHVHARRASAGQAGVVVLGHALVAAAFRAATRAIVSRTITIDARPYQVVGVMPAGFAWPLDAQFWVPSEYDESYTNTNRGAWFLGAVGRLKPGVPRRAGEGRVQRARRASSKRNTRSTTRKSA